MENKEIGLYIHIPFCKSKCYYCDFISFTNKDNYIDRYFKSLKKEILKYANENNILAKHSIEKKYLIKTIYIGGGTPSIINENHIKEIMELIKENFEIKSNAEITIEINPGTINRQKLIKYKDCGINRLSIGLQAVQNNLLKDIGRIHTYEEFINTYNIAREVGFNNINVDLMINLPYQTIEDVKDSVNTILKIKPEHISVYSLIVEENTKMYDMVENNEVELSNDEIERQMYWYVKNTLEENDFIHYEISNFAKKGYESKHNMDCWNQNEYIGLGTAASSFLKDNRYSNIKDIEKYIENIESNNINQNYILEESLNDKTRMDEYMILNLRKISGININDFKQKFNQNPIMTYCKILDKLTKEKLIEIDENYIKLSNKGIDLANLVWEEFV